MSQGQEFVLPLVLDLAAVGVFAVSGAAAAIRRGYDFIGLAALSLVTALGGAFLRDGLFLQSGPSPILLDGRYLIAVGIGMIVTLPFYRAICIIETPMLTIDALGLAAYTVVGAQKALAAGISIPGVILVAVVNGVGGSILRDIITREEPLLFKPGQYYAAAALIGASVFCTLHQCDVQTPIAAVTSIALIFFLRMASIKFNWQSHALSNPNIA